MAKLAQKRVWEAAAKAHTRDSLQALSKLGELDDGRYRIVNQPPVVIPVRDLAPELTPDRLEQADPRAVPAYRASLQPDMRHLLGHFEVVDFARKVVGVGSVGTRCFIVLLQGRDASDPLFLQVKEATNSVLEESPAAQPLPPARPAGGAGTKADAGHQRHLPRLGPRRGRQQALLLAPAAGHEGIGGHRGA